MVDLCLFAPRGGSALAAGIARRLQLPLSPLEERDFVDGEHQARPLAEVRGKDIYLVESLHSEANRSIDDKLLYLLFLIATLADAGAARITAVIPYLCYARQDQQHQPRDPVGLRYLARLFEAAGAFRVAALDVHNLAAFQNAFRCRTEHLEAAPLLASHFAARLGEVPAAVVSPDLGGIKRAERFRRHLVQSLGREVPLAFMEKHRDEDRLCGETVAGEVAGRAAVLVDDLISTGSTLLRAARACRERGATAVYGAVSHGVFAAGAGQVMADPALDQLAITDSIPPAGRLDPGLVAAKIAILPAAPLFARAIQAMHAG